MPGCMLRASGRDFEPDEFAKDSDLSIRESHRKGKPRLNGTLHDDGYIGVLVSDSSGDDIDGQVDDAVAFLRQHQDELKRLVSFPGVEDIRLDFSRLFYSDTQVCQYNFFAPKLIRLMGELGLGIELSTYAVEDSPEGGDGHQQYEHSQAAQHQRGRNVCCALRVHQRANSNRQKKPSSQWPKDDQDEANRYRNTDLQECHEQLLG